MLPPEYMRDADDAKAEHVNVYNKLNRFMELLQDVVVMMLTVTLLGLAFMFLLRVWAELAVMGNLQRAISDIIYVVITIELYRLALHYVRYHRVNLNLLVEVGVSAIIQKVVLIGVDNFSIQQLGGISFMLLALGAILWVHMHDRRYYSSLSNRSKDPDDSLPISPTSSS